MRIFWPLLKVVLKNQFQLSVLKDRYWKRKERLWEPVLFFVFLLVLIPFLLLILSFYGWLYQGLALYGEAETMVALLFAAGQLLFFVLGWFQLIGVLGFSKDGDSFLPLPITGAQLLAARLTGVWLTMLFIPGLFLLPGLLVYGMMAAVGVGGFLALIGLWLILPVAPLAVASIGVMGIMRVFHVKRLASWGPVISAVGFLAVFLLVQIFTRLNADQQPVDWERRLVEGGWVESIQFLYPPALWGMEAIAPATLLDGALAWGYLMLLSVLTLGAALPVATRWLFKGMIREERGRRKTVVGKKTLRIRSPLVALMIKEWRLHIREPVFLMSAWLPVLVVIVMSLMPMLTGEMPEGEEELVGRFDLWVGVFLTGFLSAINNVASSSVSREGRMFYLSKIIPVPPRLQVRAKWCHAAIYTWIVSVLVMGSYAWMGADIATLGMIGLLGIPLGLLLNSLAILINSIHPFLAWETPREAQRSMGSLAILLAHGGMMILCVLLVIGAYLMGLSDLLIQWGLFVLLLIANGFAFRGMGRVAERRYAAIEI